MKERKEKEEKRKRWQEIFNYLILKVEILDCLLLVSSEDLWENKKRHRRKTKKKWREIYGHLILENQTKLA